MKTFLIILISSIYSNFCLGQIIQLPTDSAVWHYSYEEPGGAIINVNYSTNGDTIINSILYTLVSTDFSELFLLRQDSAGRVYARFLDPLSYSCTDTNEILLYDFSLSVNDTFIARNCLGDSSVCIVVLKDSVLTSVGYRDQLTFSVSHIWVTCHTALTMRWISGIGNFNDLFYSLTFPPQLCLQNYTFNSLDDSGNNIYLIPNSVKNVNALPTKIWVNQKGVIHSSELISELVIYDLYGRLLFESNNLNAYYFDFLAMKELGTASYCIKIKLLGGLVKSFVVQPYR